MFEKKKKIHVIPQTTTKMTVQLKSVTMNKTQKGTHSLTLGNMMKWHILCHAISALGYSPKDDPTLKSKTLFSINRMHRRQYDKMGMARIQRS